jgi:hypothetical protein
MNKESEIGPSIADIVQMRPWKHALLTTYTLSLSYFESEILRPLLRRGCSDIWLIADAEGYRNSLLERRSMRVGQEYRLIPVALPDGVFHAKCIYLAGDEGDLLLVGSGNVTFHGHGRNNEVFEALSPNIAASAFRDFADFLEATGSRPDIRIARSEWAEDFAARARLAAERGADEDGVPAVRLVHPLNEPVMDQLPGLLAQYGGCNEATIMSPYHDREGYSLREMGAELNLNRMNIAVTEKGTSPFPFRTASAWPWPVLPVTLFRKDKRFVHAKWFEFQTDAKKLLLTGSINATRKALMTTANVELGVLRALEPGIAPLEWQDCEEPGFAPDERLPSGLKRNEIAYAAFDRDDPSLLRGSVISLQPTAGIWRGRLIQADGDMIAFEVSVETDGGFASRSAGFEGFSELPALQIVMTLGDREARGWVHNEMLLSISGRRRLTAGALSRLMRREGTDDDIEALLDYLSMQAEQHLHMFDRPVQKARDEGEGTDEETKSVTVDLAELKPGSPDTTVPSHGSISASTPDQFDLAMTRLRRVLLGHGRARSIQLQHAGESAVTEEDNPEAGTNGGLTPEDGARKLGLTDFEREIGRLIKDAESKPDIVRGLLAMELEVVMWMRTHRLNDPEGAHEFLRSWFARACRLAKPDPTRLTSLQQHIVTAAAVLFHLAAAAGNQRGVAAELHDSLERYFGGTVDHKQAQGSLFPGIEAGFAGLLTGISVKEELEAGLGTILTERTTRQQLADALALAATGAPIPKDWQVFATPLGAELHEALSSPNWDNRVKATRWADLTACAFEFYSFSPAIVSSYRRLRFAQCIHCKKFTVNLHP